MSEEMLNGTAKQTPAEQSDSKEKYYSVREVLSKAESKLAHDVLDQIPGGCDKCSSD